MFGELEEVFFEIRISIESRHNQNCSEKLDQRWRAQLERKTMVQTISVFTSPKHQLQIKEKKGMEK